MSRELLRQVWPIFSVEAREQLAVLGGGLLRLEASTDRAGLIEPIRRTAHSLKGAAGSLGLTGVERLARGLEGALAGYDPAEGLGADLVQAALDALEAIEQAVAAGDAGRPPEVAGLEARLEALAAVSPREALSDELLAGAGAALARAVGLSLTAGLQGPLELAVRAAARELGLAPSALAAAAGAGDGAALEVLAEHAVIGETSLWRHAEGLAVLSAELAGVAWPLRIWSAGCATGEEPYSLALALLDAGRDRDEDLILGTDVSARALATAREGVYGARATRRLPPGLAERWFHASGEGARVDSRLARRVVFLRHNLLDPPPPGPFDAVVCRNVLIYFEEEVAAATLTRLAGAVAPGGSLLLGPVELPLASGLDFEWVVRGGATLLRRPG